MLSRSTLRKDRVRKLASYSEFGVVEYWIVNPISKSIELFQRTDEELKMSRIFSCDEVLESAVLPGFRLPVARVF